MSRPADERCWQDPDWDPQIDGITNVEPEAWNDLPDGEINPWEGDHADADLWDAAGSTDADQGGEPSWVGSHPGASAVAPPSPPPPPPPPVGVEATAPAPAPTPAPSKPAAPATGGAPQQTEPLPPAERPTTRRTVLLGCLAVSVIAFAFVYLRAMPTTTAGQAVWQRATAAPSPTHSGPPSPVAPDVTAAVRADPAVLLEFCQHAPSAAEVIACVGGAIEAGAVDPAAVPVLYRFPECGLTLPLLDKTVTQLDDTTFVSLVGGARACFDRHVAEGSITDAQIPFEAADPACYQGVNPFRLDTAEFEQRFLAYRNCVLDD